MQELLLSDEYMKKVASGNKSQTVRMGIRPIVLGPLLIKPTNKTTENIEVDVTSIKRKYVFELNNYDAKEDGFKSLVDLILSLKRFYPDMKSDDEVTIIQWEI